VGPTEHPEEKQQYVSVTPSPSLSPPQQNLVPSGSSSADDIVEYAGLGEPSRAAPVRVMSPAKRRMRFFMTVSSVLNGFDLVCCYTRVV
jgi:hypothetical protein